MMANTTSRRSQHVTDIFNTILACLVIVIAGQSKSLAQSADFESLFDGKTLKNWRAKDPSYWTIEDGAITGTITAEHPCTENQYLILDKRILADFELKLKSRLTGQGAINNGFQFRSLELPDGDVCGYQVDNNLQTPWLVRLYDEYGRHDLALRGQHTNFAEDGQRTTIELKDVPKDPWFQLEQWHEYHLICLGSEITLYVDGQLAAKVKDEDLRRQDRQGILALQLHSGPETRVQFKNIQLKVLNEPRSMRSQVLTRAQREWKAKAVAWWQMETGGHGATPPLKHFPQFYQFQWNVRAHGKGIQPQERVAELDGAWFDAGDVLPASPETFTILIRGKWEGDDTVATLLSRPAAVDDKRQAWLWQLEANAETGQQKMKLHFAVDAEGDNGPAEWQIPLPSESKPDATTYLKSDGSFHQWVLRYDGRQLSVFQDDKLLGQRPCPGMEAAGALRLAAMVDGQQATEPFRGQLSLVAIWDQALTDRQIESLTSESRAGQQP